MSDTPDDGQSGQGQGGQTNQGQQSGGQSTGGQGGQQAPAGQPAAGQPGGQPPQQAYNTGPGPGDIFSIPETMAEIKYGLVMFALVGLGTGIGLIGVTSSAGGGGSGLGGFAAALGALSGIMSLPILLTAVMAYLVSSRQVDKLADQPNNIAMATAAVTSALGALVGYLITVILAMLGAGGFGFNGLILPLILSAVGAAVIGLGVVWAERSLLAPSPRGAPQAGAQTHQQR